jgi:hypothetical protein
MAVIVLDRVGRLLNPCSEKRARLLLERSRATVNQIDPFTIKLLDRIYEDYQLQETGVIDNGE